MGNHIRRIWYGFLPCDKNTKDAIYVIMGKFRQSETGISNLMDVDLYANDDPSKPILTVSCCRDELHIYEHLVGKLLRRIRFWHAKLGNDYINWILDRDRP